MSKKQLRSAQAAPEYAVGPAAAVISIPPPAPENRIASPDAFWQPYERKQGSFVRSSRVFAALVPLLISALLLGGSYPVLSPGAAPSFASTASAAAQAGGEFSENAAGYIRLSAAPPRISETVDPMTAGVAMLHLSRGIGNRFVGTSGNRTARDWLLSQLANYGYKTEAGTLYEQPFYTHGSLTGNIIATRPAAAENAPIIIISAHLDTVYGVDGAVDNASGVSVLLSLAEAVGKRPDYARNAELRFIFFSGEELGYRGAYAYLNNLSNTERTRIYGVFNIDMAAHFTTDVPKALCMNTLEGSMAAPKGNVVTDAGNAVYAAGNFDMTFYAPIHWGLNDIVPFYYAGIPAATLSWREISPARAVTNYDIATPRLIHTYGDTLDNTDMPSLYTTVDFAARVLDMMAGALLAQGSASSV